MKKSQFNRRKFLKQTVAGAAGLATLSTLPPEALAAPKIFSEGPIGRKKPLLNPAEPRIRFSVIGINHGHIYGQVEAVLEGGGEFVSYYAKEPELLEPFAKAFPQAKLVKNEKEILEDESIHLVLSSIIPDQRAPLGIKVMKHGKDYMADKPGITTLEQLEEVRRVQKETGRIYSIMFSERLRNKATVKAGELAKAGAIGNVIQTIGLGPHRMSPERRPDWFFDRDRFGGIIGDIGSHQLDQFLFFTGTTEAEVIASQIGNLHHPQYPKFEDFGDLMVRGNGGTGYVRVDWFTPDGLNSWGDGRLTILGSEGYMEVRKNIDIAGRDGGDHLFLVDQNKTQYIDCSNVELPYGEQLVNDVINRTETAMRQEHVFLATELALKAQKQAKRVNFEKKEG